MRFLLIGSSLLAISATATQADVPNIVTDIAPVQGLVSQVLGDLGTSYMLLPAGGSPHYYALKPSDAKALSDAQIVFWVDGALTPWLKETIEAQNAQTTVVTLSGLPGVTQHNFREGALFEAHDHAEDHAHEDHDHADEHKHDDHGDEDHKDHDAHDHDEHDHDEHDHDEHGHDDHDHSGLDPHLWLDPMNAMLWLDEIAQELSKLDPENAKTYEANATAAISALEIQVEEIAQSLSGLAPKFVVTHDAYQYFELRFGVPATAAIADGDDTDPSAGRVAEVKAMFAEQQIDCVMLEPLANRGLVDAVREADTPVVTIDPIGTDIAVDAGFYPALMTSIANSFLSCKK